MLERPSIANDTLFGQQDGHDLAMPLSGVSRIAVPEHENAKTGAGLTFMAATVLTVLVGWLILVVAN
jgi:hypothetical protein